MTTFAAHTGGSKRVTLKLKSGYTLETTAETVVKNWSNVFKCWEVELNGSGTKHLAKSGIVDGQAFSAETEMTTFSAGEMFGASKHWTCNWKNAQGVEVQKGVDAASAHDAALLIRRMYDVPSTTQVNVAEYSRATLAKGPYQTFDNSDADPAVRAKAAAFAKSLKPSSREADMTTIRVPRPNAGKADITVKPSTEDGQGERIPGRFSTGEMFGSPVLDNATAARLKGECFAGDDNTQTLVMKTKAGDIIPMAITRTGESEDKAKKLQDARKWYFHGKGTISYTNGTAEYDGNTMYWEKGNRGFSAAECFGVTGPTRMQIQQAYESEKSAGATERDAVRKIEARFGISGVVVNQSGDVVSWQGEASFAAGDDVEILYNPDRLRGGSAGEVRYSHKDANGLPVYVLEVGAVRVATARDKAALVKIAKDAGIRSTTFSAQEMFASDNWRKLKIQPSQQFQDGVVWVELTDSQIRSLKNGSEPYIKCWAQKSINDPQGAYATITKEDVAGIR